MKVVLYLLLGIILVVVVLGQSANIGVSLGLVDETCSDGLQNQNETGIDCGGVCPACPTCSDGLQNQGETGIDCGGPCDACASAGSGGGGGGGFSGGTVVNSTKIIAPANTSVGYLIDDDVVYDIEVTPLEESINTTIFVESLPIPSNQNLSDSEYHHFKVYVNNIFKIEKASLWFRINKTWVVENEASGFILLNKQVSWHEMPTEYIGNDENYYYFRGDVKSFGEFSIVTKHDEIETIVPFTENPFIKQLVEVQRSESPLIQSALLLLLVISIFGSLRFAYIRSKDTYSRFSHYDNKIIDIDKRIKDIGKRIKKL